MEFSAGLEAKGEGVLEGGRGEGVMMAFGEGKGCAAAGERGG